MIELQKRSNASLHRFAIAGCLSAVIAGFVVIAGPFLFYGSLVPHLTPVLPKPDGVPDHATASYSWKGFGMAWNWEDQLDGACGRWLAAETNGRPVRILYLNEGERRCDEGERLLTRYSFDRRTIYANQPNEWPYSQCPFSLSDTQIAHLLDHMVELRRKNPGEREAELLDSAIAELETLDVAALRMRQFGCGLPHDPITNG